MHAAYIPGLGKTRGTCFTILHKVFKASSETGSILALRSRPKVRKVKANPYRNKEVHMRKAGIVILSLGIALMGLAVSPAVSEAGGSVSIGLHETFVGPAYGPGYRVSNVSFGLVFHQGFWYRPFKGHWYRSRWRTGPWGYIAPRWAPRGRVILPPARHHRGPEHFGHSYGRHERHWRRW